MEVGRSKLSHFTNDQASELMRLFARVAEGDVGLARDADGNVSFSPALPTSEPAAVGALWTNTLVVTVSNGP